MWYLHVVTGLWMDLLNIYFILVTIDILSIVPCCVLFVNLHLTTDDAPYGVKYIWLEIVNAKFKLLLSLKI